MSPQVSLQPGRCVFNASRGERPSVISALMKYQTTERMRRSVNDAFDVHGGRAICDGPTNYLQSAYQMVPKSRLHKGLAAAYLTRRHIEGRAFTGSSRDQSPCSST